MYEHGTFPDDGSGVDDEWSWGNPGTVLCDECAKGMPHMITLTAEEAEGIRCADCPSCAACSASIAHGYRSPNDDKANRLRFCKACTEKDTVQ